MNWSMIPHGTPQNVFSARWQSFALAIFWSLLIISDALKSISCSMKMAVAVSASRSVSVYKMES